MTEKIGDDESDRRSFIRKLAAAAGAGAAGLLLQQEFIESVSAAGAAGQVAFYTAPDTYNGDNSLFWDNTNKRLGVGTTGPARSVHLVGNNACFRMDRDVNSSAFILVRTKAGDFTTIWKTFYVGVDASGVNNGSFFIGDVGTNVSGPSAVRLLIDNSGNVLIGTTTTTTTFGTKLHVVGSQPAIVVEDSGTYYPSLLFRRAGQNKWVLLENWGTPTDNIAFYDYSSSATVFQINQGGNVGVGTTSPERRLDVQHPGYATARFKNRATTGDRTALVDIETGDASPVMWRYGVGGANNGLGLTQGEFYFENYGAGAKLILDTNGWLLPGASGSQVIGSSGKGLTWVNIFLDTMTIYGESGFTRITPNTDNTGSIGTNSRRWNLVRAVNVTSGDFVFENSFRVTENGSDGLAFANARNEKIATLDSEGNLFIKGRLIEQQDLGEAQRAMVAEETRIKAKGEKDAA